jgi:hypothetical protein
MGIRRIGKRKVIADFLRDRDQRTVFSVVDLAVVVPIHPAKCAA